MDFKVLFEKYNVDLILLPNCDDFTMEHIENSVLHNITGFMGTAGEAVIAKNGEIYLFVDPRYHIQAASMAHPNVNVVKMQMGQGFITLLSEKFGQNSNILIDKKFVTYDFYEKLKSKFSVIIGDFENRCTSKPIKFNLSTSKINILKDKLNNVEYDNILITKTEDVSYITGLNSFDIPYSSSIRAKLLITKNENKLIFGDFEKIEGKTVLFKDNLSLSDYLNVETPILFDQNYVASMMSIKTKEEIEGLQKSFKKLDIAIDNFKKNIKEGLSEFELKEIFEGELMKLGAKSLSFKTILAIDKNTASIHYSTYDKNKFLKSGDMILLDCGAYFEDSPYATDITRTFIFGIPNEKQKQVYTNVLKAFLNCYNSTLKYGFELDKLARDVLNKAKFEGFEFPHGLGHGVGYNVHSFPPVLSPKGNMALEPGMVFSIEPGLYKEGEFGVRIENVVWVDENSKKHSLSSSPLELNLIDFSILNEKEQEYLKEWKLQ